MKETNNSILERNRALLQYVATIANSNSSSDKFNYEFVESLVNGGADINIADQYGQSIFHEVARSWDSDVAQFLLDIGKDLPKFVPFSIDWLQLAFLTHATIFGWLFSRNLRLSRSDVL